MHFFMFLKDKKHEYNYMYVCIYLVKVINNNNKIWTDQNGIKVGSKMELSLPQFFFPILSHLSSLSLLFHFLPFHSIPCYSIPLHSIPGHPPFFLPSLPFLSHRLRPVLSQRLPQDCRVRWWVVFPFRFRVCSLIGPLKRRRLALSSGSPVQTCTDVFGQV